MTKEKCEAEEASEEVSEVVSEVFPVISNENKECFICDKQHRGWTKMSKLCKIDSNCEKM